MRILPLFCSLFLISSLSAETVTLIAQRRTQSSSPTVYASQTITLAVGEIATTRFLSSHAYLDVAIDDLVIRLEANTPDQVNLPVIAGPATIRLANISTSRHALATLSIKRTTDTAAISPQVVVIPDDGSGDREVRLESSTDMVNWTATQPGLFGSSNSARFFRVRVAKVETNASR